MNSDLTSVPAGFYRACYEHLDAGTAWYRGSGPAAHPGARGGGGRHDRDDGAGLVRGDLRSHGAVRRRVRGDRNATFALLIEQLPEARASALWNLAYDAGYRAGPAPLRPDLRPHRLPGGVRPYRRADPRRSPGGLASGRQWPASYGQRDHALRPAASAQQAGGQSPATTTYLSRRVVPTGRSMG